MIREMLRKTIYVEAEYMKDNCRECESKGGNRSGYPTKVYGMAYLKSSSTRSV